LKRHAIPRKHRVKREDAIDFMKNMFNLKVGE